MDFVVGMYGYLLVDFDITFWGCSKFLCVRARRRMEVAEIVNFIIFIFTISCNQKRGVLQIYIYTKRETERRVFVENLPLSRVARSSTGTSLAADNKPSAAGPETRSYRKFIRKVGCGRECRFILTAQPVRFPFVPGSFFCRLPFIRVDGSLRSFVSVDKASTAPSFSLPFSWRCLTGR